MPELNTQQFIDSFFSYFTSPELLPQPFLSIFNILRAVFLVFSLILFILIVISIHKGKWLKYRFEDTAEFYKFKPSALTKMAKEWQRIINRLESKDEAEHKLAIIEADDMVDKVLSRFEYPGKTLGEKLKNLSAEIIPNIEELKQVHQTRSDIVHDLNYRLDVNKAKEILKVYEKFFVDLKVL